MWLSAHVPWSTARDLDTEIPRGFSVLERDNSVKGLYETYFFSRFCLYRRLGPSGILLYPRCQASGPKGEQPVTDRKVLGRVLGPLRSWLSLTLGFMPLKPPLAAPQSLCAKLSVDL